MNDRTKPNRGAADEPGLTEENSRTIRAEEQLEGGGYEEEDEFEESSTHTKIGTIPTSYGAAGGTTDATEEGGDGSTGI